MILSLKVATAGRESWVRGPCGPTGNEPADDQATLGLHDRVNHKRVHNRLDMAPGGGYRGPRPRTTKGESVTRTTETAARASAVARQVLIEGHPFPLKRNVAGVFDALIGSLFPQLALAPARDAEHLGQRIDEACERFGAIAAPLAASAPGDLAEELLRALPNIHARSLADAAAILAGDPAAESLDEVIAAYPGFLAISAHRLAHAVHHMGVPIVPRLMAELAHSRSGVDIHPAASIGHSFCIDHGTGIVVGETAVIGDEVKLYQGVTLGALSVSKDKAGTKRHPTIGDRVVIYANATVLGGDTTIGADSIVGGNVFLTSSVPPGSLIYQTAEYRVRRHDDGFNDIDFVI
jgi:serine O-acetyltransferase